MTELLTALAVVVVVVTGLNDGGTLLAPGLRVPTVSVFGSLAILTAAAVAVPLLVTTAVASTMTESFVPADRDGARVLAVGVAAAMVIVTALARLELPTSLTLAIVGGIAGAGAGSDLAVAWTAVGRVLAIGAAAPALGCLLALCVARLWRTDSSSSFLATVRWTHRAAFALQSVAYGANDGQKMLVLFAAAGVAAGRGTSIRWWVYPVIAAGFALGAVAGLPRAARSVGTGVLNARQVDIVTAEVSAAAAVLGSAAVGAPVSMTQSTVGGLIGAGVHETAGRVRWQQASRLALAWVVTLPATFALSALAGLAIRVLLL